MMIDCVGGHGFALQLFNSLPHALHHHRHHHGSGGELIRRTHVWCDDSDCDCVCVCVCVCDFYELVGVACDF